MEKRDNREHLKQLEDAVSRLGLSGLAEAVLEEIAKDPHGLDQKAAPSILASLTDSRLEECQEELLELFGQKLLLRIESMGETRIVANYSALGLSVETREALHMFREPLQTLGLPHSPKAMQILGSWFLEERQPIYLMLEVTSHKAFRLLRDRAAKHHMTTFIMPHRSCLPESRRLHYEEILKEWKTFLRSGPKEIRRWVRLCITTKAHMSLYTSALGPEFVRFNSYSLDDNTTRRGTMIVAPKGTSLYDLVYDQYEEVYTESYPLGSVWPLEFLKARWSVSHRLVLGPALFVAGAFSYWLVESLGPFLASIFVAVGGSLVVDHYRQRRWIRRTLCKK